MSTPNEYVSPEGHSTRGCGYLQQEKRDWKYARVYQLHDQGLSNVVIGIRTGYRASTVLTILKKRREQTDGL